jgi:hypothetical protein
LTNTFQHPGKYKPGLWLLPLFLGGTVLAFCCYYIAGSHVSLVKHFTGLNPCIYRSAVWEEWYFNAATKQAGNFYAIAGILVGAILIIWSLVSMNSWRVTRLPVIAVWIRSHYVQLGALLLVTLGTWLWGTIFSVPAYDEVFSAVNCANVHPIQTLGYYMLPNNHILFNFINNLVFHFIYDKVLTGRIISGICEVILAVVVYWWLYKKLAHKGYALLYTTLLLLQFPTWGFSFQGRGYALYTLCAFVSLIGVEQYLKYKSRNWLAAHTLAVIIGFGVMPSFLFWYAGLLLIVISYFVWSRQSRGGLIRAQVFAGLCIYCFYLPGILYTGLDAFTNNRYVAALPISLSEYWPQFTEKLNSTIQFCFGANVDSTNYLYTGLFYLPFLALPFLFRTKAGFVLAFNALLWVAFALLQIKFRHYPFMRNMVAHVSISLCATLLSLHFMLKWLGEKLRLNWILPICSTLFCTAAGVHFVRFMSGHVNDSLYFYDAKAGYDLPMNTIKKIPMDAHVWCTDESFYLQYLLRRRGTDASQCANESQTYSIVDKNENLKLSPGLKAIDSVQQYVIYYREPVQ